MKKQNYKESKKILEKIDEAESILIGSHRSPDADTLGCALSLYQTLKKRKKKVEVICPGGVPASFDFLPYFEDIKVINFDTYEFSDYDLFLSLDTPSVNYFTGGKVDSIPQIPIIVIDHHKTNPRFGEINLIDSSKSSAAEVLYLVLEDWEVDIDEDTASTLLAGIVGDTGAFRYPGAGYETFDIASKLMKLGADKDELVLNLYHTIDIELIKFWGEALKRIEIDESGEFVWSAVPFEVYKKCGSPAEARETVASMFGQIVKGTQFGVIMVEQTKGRLSISLRSRTGFDTTKVSTELGGGGHVYASGAKVDAPFEKALDKVLKVSRKYAKKSKKSNN